MAAKLNHTIVAARNKHESATFLSEILGLPAPVPFGHFLVVATGNDVSIPAGGLPSGRHMILRVKNTPRFTNRVVVGPECEASTPGKVNSPRR